MPKQKRSRIRALILSLLGLVVVVAVGLTLTGKLPFNAFNAQADDADSTVVASSDSVKSGEDPEDPGEIPVPVEVARVERRAIAAFYRAASVIEADRLVDLTAKVTGRVQVLNVEEGDWVRQGDILAELENGRERIGLRQAELRLAEQQRLHDRNQAMRTEGLISSQAFEDVQSAFELAEANRDLARIVLEETIIRAPFNGQVTDRKIVLGQQVYAAIPLLTLADFEPLRVRVYLPEAIARKVTAGQRVLVYPEASDAPLEATVERVAPVVDPITSTMRLTMLLAGGQQEALVGGFVKVRITTDYHNEALAIPKLALVEEGGLRSVFVAEADSVRKAEIRTGLYDESHIEILDGLVEESLVITIGQGGLRNGSRIEVLNAEAVGLADADELSPAIPAAETTIAQGH
ncbi:MAG: efflux RND transporter periplasmic adaptor subunit [bacterium]